MSDHTWITSDVKLTYQLYNTKNRENLSGKLFKCVKCGSFYTEVSGYGYNSGYENLRLKSCEEMLIRNIMEE